MKFICNVGLDISTLFIKVSALKEDRNVDKECTNVQDCMGDRSNKVKPLDTLRNILWAPKQSGNKIKLLIKGGLT